MQNHRVILYSDLNSYYASVEAMLQPYLRGKAFAVCGNIEERRGIVLAKSDLAKRRGVKTGMSIKDALLHCPKLIIVPPHYDEYRKYSLLVRREYEQYTDLIEAIGWDECALDVTASRLLFGSGYEIAQNIQKGLREKYGLTASIGVSFCKIIGKLASDMRKPDAITVIDREHFEEIVWPLPITDMCFIGYSRATTLMKIGINTLGDLARASPEKLYRVFGQDGVLIWRYANGEDYSAVIHKDFVSPIKSIGHGSTAVSNLVNDEEVWKCMLDLAQDLGHRLRVCEMAARGVQISVRDSGMEFKQCQGMLSSATQSPRFLAEKAMELFKRNYRWTKEVRALCIRVIQVVPKDTPQQVDFFCDPQKKQAQERLDDTIDALHNKFGNQCIYPAVLMGDHKMPKSSVQETYMPSPMSRC